MTVGAVTLALFSLLGVVYVIQRDNGEEYNKIILSQRQSEYVSRTLPYRRGDIYDRNGTKLATSEKVYNLILDPKQMIESEGDTSEGKAAARTVVEPTINALAEYFGFDKAELEKLISENAGSQYIRYKREVSYTDREAFNRLVDEKNAAFAKSDDIAERKKLIRGYWFEDEYKRTYPYNALGCNLIGFASADGTSGTGGVEQYYNDQLIGTNGREYGYLNDEANLEHVVKPAENGNTLVLTMDANIQNIVEKYLAEWKNGDIGSKTASAIVMDPKTGEVLAMASTNSFDLNNPRNTDGYTQDQLYQMGLAEAVGVYRREHPDAAEITEEQVPQYYSRDEILSYGKQVAWNQLWRNIPVSDTFEPGSTQKIFTVGGALEEAVIKETDTFDCKGYIELNDGSRTWRINCVNRNGHGILDVTNGITQSCNVVMMNIAFLEKSETFMKYQRLFGFGDYTGIDLPAEEKGLGAESDNIGKTQLATNSFGQNYTSTMIQMAAAYCSVINGGYYYQPHVVKQILTADGTVAQDIEPTLVRETLSKSTCDFLIEALFKTVEVGTGKAAAVEGYHVGGKTGTAQKLPRSAQKYLVSFCGFAPVEDPQLLVYVTVDEPNLPGEQAAHSSFASGIFSKIMADALPVLNIYPDGVNANDYKAPDALLPSEEGDSKLPMGSAESTEAQAETTVPPTDENGETLLAPTETAADGQTVPVNRPAETDEYIQGGDAGGVLPDDLSAQLGTTAAQDAGALDTAAPLPEITAGQTAGQTTGQTTAAQTTAAAAGGVAHQTAAVTGTEQTTAAAGGT